MCRKRLAKTGQRFLPRTTVEPYPATIAQDQRKFTVPPAPSDTHGAQRRDLAQGHLRHVGPSAAKQIDSPFNGIEDNVAHPCPQQADHKQQHQRRDKQKDTAKGVFPHDKPRPGKTHRRQKQRHARGRLVFGAGHQPHHPCGILRYAHETHCSSRFVPCGMSHAFHRQDMTARHYNRPASCRFSIRLASPRRADSQLRGFTSRPVDPIHAPHAATAATR